jgi:dihydroxyacetone kinase-like predicted kinase
VEGTILTVARDAAAAAVAVAAAGGALADVLRAARDEGRASLARTPDLLPVLRDAGVVDAGGAGLLLLVDAALLVTAGDPLPNPSLVDGAAVTPSDDQAAHDPGDMRYDVMFLLELADPRIAELRARLARLGSSVVVGGGDGTWSCHVHTDDIGGAIEAALELDGRPSRIRVTDLFARERSRMELAQ